MINKPQQKALTTLTLVERLTSYVCVAMKNVVGMASGQIFGWDCFSSFEKFLTVLVLAVFKKMWFKFWVCRCLPAPSALPRDGRASNLDVHACNLVSFTSIEVKRSENTFKMYFYIKKFKDVVSCSGPFWKLISRFFL